MNEKIKELAEQAMWHTNSKTGEVYRTHFQFEKRFAELIVRECISMADQFEIDVNRAGLVDRIKEHFGVE